MPESVEYQAGDTVFTTTVDYGVSGSAITTTLPDYRAMRQEVEMIRDEGGLIYVTGELVTVDQDFSVAWHDSGDMFGAMIETNVYSASSRLPIVSEQQLRAAGSEYPDWVAHRYLALPDTLPERVVSLAHDLTATESTPFDRALAIESYLRTIPYSLDVPAPPHDQDMVDYFIFDLQEGYCDYYATAMVVLARVAGVPARLVVGYAGGSYNSYRGRYIITEADAHAWPEIFFPGYGWIAFEPTAGVQPIVRPTGSSRSFDWSDFEVESPTVKWWHKPSLLGWLRVIGGLALLILTGVIWMAADGWRLRRLEPAQAIATLYRRLRKHGQRLAVPVREASTPYEFTALLAERVDDLIQDEHQGKVMTLILREVRRLVDLYVQMSYSARPLGYADRAHAIRSWRTLRWRLWLVRVWENKLYKWVQLWLGP
jgi:transglutaminase-like putative cysteine protease